MRRKKKDIVPRKKKPARINIMEKVANILELPKEVALDNPRIILVGRKKLVMENFKGISGYDPDSVRLKTSLGRVVISGAGLTISEVTAEDILVEGFINSVFFEADPSSMNQKALTKGSED